MIPDIRKVQSSLEDAMALAVNAADKAVPSMGREEAARYLQDMADHWAAKVTRDYKALGDRLLVKYLDGNIKKENPDGSFARTPEGMAVSPVFGGYNQEYFDNIVRHTGDHFKGTPRTAEITGFHIFRTPNVKSPAPKLLLVENTVSFGRILGVFGTKILLIKS